MIGAAAVGTLVRHQSFSSWCRCRPEECTHPSAVHVLEAPQQLIHEVNLVLLRQGLQWHFMRMAVLW